MSNREWMTEEPRLSVNSPLQFQIRAYFAFSRAVESKGDWKISRPRLRQTRPDPTRPDHTTPDQTRHVDRRTDFGLADFSLPPLRRSAVSDVFVLFFFFFFFFCPVFILLQFRLDCPSLLVCDVSNRLVVRAFFPQLFDFFPRRSFCFYMFFFSTIRSITAGFVFFLIQSSDRCSSLLGCWLVIFEWFVLF